MMTSNCCIYLTKDWFLAGGSIVICPFWPITWARNYEVSLWFGCWRVCLSSLHAARRPCQHAPSIQVKHTHGWLAAEDAASRCWAGWRIRDRLLVLRLAPGQDWGWMEPMFNKQDSYSSEGDEKGWEDVSSASVFVCPTLMWTWREIWNELGEAWEDGCTTALKFFVYETKIKMKWMHFVGLQKWHLKNIWIKSFKLIFSVFCE